MLQDRWSVWEKISAHFFGRKQKNSSSKKRLRRMLNCTLVTELRLGCIQGSSLPKISDMICSTPALCNTMYCHKIRVSVTMATKCHNAIKMPPGVTMSLVHQEPCQCHNTIEKPHGAMLSLVHQEPCKCYNITKM